MTGKRKIVLATHNKGKIRELSAMLAHENIEIAGLEEFPQIGETEETGTTFAENALLKARAVAGETGLVSIADDSGLMVDALGGKPGIYSARFGQDWEFLPNETRDERNIRKLLSLMEKEDDRNCRFVTAMAAVRPDGEEIVCHGHWQGLLLRRCRGHNGFGYDPVFYDPELGKTAAELLAAEKNSRSHRSRALHALLDRLPQFLQ